MATTPTNKPIPSEDPRDLKFNAGKIDEEVNGSADYYTDRFGVQRLTNTGRDNRFQTAQDEREAEFVASQADKEARFQQFLLNSGYQFLGDYENGPYTITALNQVIRYQGEFWRLNASTTPPYTTTGIDNTSWAVDVTHLVSVGDAKLRQDLSSTTLPGLSLVGLSGNGNLNHLLGNHTSPEAWGVVPNSEASAHANSRKMFDMFESLRSKGGGVVFFTPGRTYWIDFIQFVPSNVVIIGYGATVKQINPLSMYGRGGFVFGSSREWNYQKAKTAYLANSYPASVSYSSMPELALGSYLRDNQSYLQCERCTVYGLRMETKFTDSTYWGGYAFNTVNAQHIRFYDVKGSGWTQLFNFGNDSSASSPSCDDVYAFNSTVESADLVRSYYAIGFIANSTNCGFDTAVLLKPMTVDSINGSGAATNYTENCVIRNINIPDLGLTSSSEGVLLNNSKGCLIENIDIRNCKNVVSTYYTVDSYNDTAKPNILRNISGQGVNIIAIRAKYAHIESFEGVGTYTNEVQFANNNASGNTINKKPKSIGFGGTNLQSWFLTNNTVKGWSRKYFYIRPSEILLNDKVDTFSWNENKLVATKSGVNLYFMWRVPDDINAIDDIRAFIRFNTAVDQDASVAGSTVEASLIQMVAFDGNIGETPYVAFSNSKVATAGVEDTTVVTQMGSNVPGLVYMDDTTHGLSYSWYVLFKMTNNVNNNYMKEIRVAGYN